MLSLALMSRHITMLQISINGALRAMRRHIWKAICKLVTSVVIRVTRPAVLNLSMLEKENVWMFSNMLCRRLQAKPEEAEAANRPARMPKARPKKASTIISAP